ncbi:MAG: hypothetical protein K2J50_02045 [Treponemataceae bacterium]|nr:hypothetical protein [Treponemataceae bacterium]
MDEAQFRDFLEKKTHSDGKHYTQKSITARMGRARRVEKLLGRDLDEAVSSDVKMHESLLTLRDYDDKKRNHQNITRLYYEFRNGKTSPKLRDLAEI